MSTDLYGSHAAWLWADSPPDDYTPWRELHRLAQRADVSVEHLCQTVAAATGNSHESKTALTYSLNDDLDAVVHALADDSPLEANPAFEFDDYDFDLESKATWNEAEHPRDSRGRFSDGSGSGVARTDSHDAPVKPAPVITQDALHQVKGELKGIHREIKKVLGRSSRWSRHLIYQDQKDLRAVGRKDGDCTITIAKQLFPDHNNGTDTEQARRICTLLHESLHALAATTPEDYGKAVGWEEAVIDQTTRLYRDHVAQTLGLHIPQTEFDKRDEGHAYNLLVKSIENIRQGLADNGHPLAANPHAFYHHLMAIPASQKQAYIEGEVKKTLATLSGKEKRTLFLSMDRSIHVLSSYKHPHLKADTDIAPQGQTHPMTRDELVDMILSTRTREEVIATRQAIDAWMEEHPDDMGILDGAEMVAMLADLYDIRTPEERERTRQLKLLLDKLDANPSMNFDEDFARIDAIGRPESTQ